MIGRLRRLKVARRFRELNGGIFYPHMIEMPYYIHFYYSENASIVSSVSSTNYCGYQRGWAGKTKEITQQVIDEFGAENFVKWAKGEL